MRLSEVPGDRALEVLSDVLEPMGRIVGDEIVRAAAKGDDKTVALVRLAKAMLDRHPDDVYQVLAAIQGETPDEYKAERRLPQVLSDIKDVLTDEELLGFLA